MKAEDTMSVISQVLSTLETATTFCYCKSMHAHTCHGPPVQVSVGRSVLFFHLKDPRDWARLSILGGKYSHPLNYPVGPTNPFFSFLFLFPSLFLCPVSLLDMVSHSPGTHVVCSTRLPASTRDLPSVSHSYWCAQQSLSSLELGRMWMENSQG